MTSSRDQRADPRAARLLRVGRFFGVPIYFAPSWILIATLITITYNGIFYDSVDGISRPTSYLAAIGFAVALALCVLVHELGHVAVSLALGTPVRRVVIFLLGGVSEIEQDLDRPRDEFLVALAGPLVSVAIAAAAFGGYQVAGVNTLASVLCILLAWSNLIVAVFNLLPGLPLDGGRALRAVVWQLSHSRVTGTRVASWVGRGIAVLVVLPGLFLQRADGGFASALFGLALGAFIWFGATQSLRMAELQDRMPELDLPRLLRPGLFVTPELSVAEALRRTWESHARGLVIVDGADRPRAIVDERRIRAVPVDRQAWTSVADVSRAIEPGMVLPLTLTGQALVDAVREFPASEYLVVRPDGSPAGILAASDLAAALTSSSR